MNLTKMKKKKGFTLIELIIVIAILAILAAVAVPQFGKIRENANKSTDISNGKTISNAIATLLAEDKLTLPTSEVTILLDGIADADYKGMTAPESDNVDTAILDYLQSTPKAKLSSKRGKYFTAKVSTEGKITIEVDGVVVYPETATSNVYYK